MSEKYCAVCGHKLSYTTYNVWWCVNCGKLVENQDVSDDDDKSPRSYVG